MHSKQILALLAALLMTVTGAMAAALMPDDVLVVIEVQGFDKAVKEVETVAKVLGLPLESQALTAMAGQQFGSPDLAAFDRTRLVRGFVLADADTQVGGVVLALPLSDNNGAAYTKALNAAYGNVKKKGDVLVCSENQGGALSPLCVAIVAGKALVSDKADPVKKIAAHIAKGTIKDAFKVPIPGTIRVGVNMVACRKMAEAAFGNAQAGGNPGAAMIMGPMQGLLGVARQFDMISIGLKISRGNVTIVTRIDPSADSTLAGMIRKTQAPSALYLSLLEPGSPLVVAGSGLHAADDLIDPYIEWLKQIQTIMGDLMGGGQPGAAPDPFKEINAALSQLKGLYSGDFACGLVTGPDGKGLAYAQISAVNDTQKATQINDAMLKLSTQEGGPAAASPVKVRAGESRTYKGVKIASYSYTFENQMGMPMPPAVAELINKMKVEIAFTKNAAIQVMGNAKVMDLVIDRLSSPGARIDQTKPLIKLFPKLTSKPVAIWTFDILATAKAIISRVANADPNVFQDIPGGKGEFGGLTFKKRGALLSIIRMSMDELVAIKNATPMLAMKAMPMLMALAAGAQPRPAGDPKEQCIENLRMIDGAKEGSAIDRELEDGDTTELKWILEYMKDGKMPTCPAGGTYSINAIGQPPTCSEEGHKLD